MKNFTETLNFSQKKENQTAIKLHNRNRDFNYYCYNLMLYCANNDIDISKISKDDFFAAVKIMRDHWCHDLSTDYYYFWIG